MRKVTAIGFRHKRILEKLILSMMLTMSAGCGGSGGSDSSLPIIDTLMISPQPVITDANLTGHAVGMPNDTLSYRWSIGGIENIAVGSDAIWHSSGIPGTYIVRLSVQNSALRTATAETTIAIASRSPWPKEGGDIQGTGRSVIASSSIGVLGWIASFWGLHTAPAIAADGTIYVAPSAIHAMNPDGTLRWSYSFPDGSSAESSPTVGGDGTIFVGTCGGSDGGGLFAVNPDGTLKWQFVITDRYVRGTCITSSPALAADGTIYFGDWNNLLYAVNQNGTLKWSYTAASEIWPSPVQAPDGTIYVTSKYDGTLHAVRPDGTTKWTFSTGSVTESRAVVDSDGTIYFGANDGFLYAVKPDGTIKWKFLADFSLTGSSPAIAVDNTIYLGNKKSLCALRPDGSLKWSLDLGDFVYTVPVVDSNGVVYVSTWSNMYAIYPDSGVKWIYPMPSGYHVSSSPAIGADGTLHFGAENLAGDSQLHAVR